MTGGILMVVPDLLTGTRIRETGRALGLEIASVPAAALLARCAAEPPALVILDLAGAGDPLGAVRALRADPRTATVPVTGFYAHVDEALRHAAIAAGVTTVLPRSAFSRRLPELLRAAGPVGTLPPSPPTDAASDPARSPMSDPSAAATHDRVSISCPGCGRHDWVSWPAGQEQLRWTCFNCSKESVLDRRGGH